MISKLIGIVEEINEDNITLNVNGVGYLVYITNNHNYEISPEGVSLHIQTIVKEDAINLYGFKSLDQKQLFNILILVQGVGAKIALLMMAKLSVADIQKAIMFEDINTLKSINGVGIKVAQRLVNELKDKITKISALRLESEDRGGLKKEENIDFGNLKDVILALEALGYSKFETTKVLSKIQQKDIENMSTEDIIKECLIYIAQGLGK